MADTGRARLTLETSLARVERGEETDLYLRDAVRAAIVLLGGDTLDDVDEDADERELLVDATEVVNGLWDGTGRRSGW